MADPIQPAPVLSIGAPKPSADGGTAPSIDGADAGGARIAPEPAATDLATSEDRNALPSDPPFELAPITERIAKPGRREHGEWSADGGHREHGERIAPLGMRSIEPERDSFGARPSDGSALGRRSRLANPTSLAPGVSLAPPPPPRGLRRRTALARLQAAARPLPLLGALAFVLERGESLPEAVSSEPNRERAIALALALRGIFASPLDVHFVSPSPPLLPLNSPVVRERALVRAARREQPHDIYLVEARRSPEGRLFDLVGIHNLTETSAAGEEKLVVNDDRAAWVIEQDGAISTVQLLDLRGESREIGADWKKLARVQNSVTNLQQTGQLRGLRRRLFRLEPAAYKVVLGLSPEALLIDADAHKIRVPNGGGAIEGEQYLRDVTPPKAQPGSFVTWAVDRARALPWFGDRNLELFKAVAFEGKDQLEQIVNTVTGEDGSGEVAEELGRLYGTPPAKATDPETGWPPPPMETLLKDPLKGEGQWVSLEQDPFVIRNPGAPVPFVFSFIRTDRKRIWSQVYVTLWDPRQVELDTVSGTVEPKSATGETGTGLVPRDPKVLGRFVAAFNGGFQAIHGEFGMMASRVPYLPPKPYGATVAKLADGSTGFGTWPESPEIPGRIVSYRQNMTPLIANDVINPYKRHWWGGVPPGWTEESRTVRSAVCMTREGFAGYFYGASVDPDVLALAMKQARCTYGVHLDMNAGHTGLEFYRVGRTGTLPTLSRRLDPTWEARGRVPRAPGWEFMCRRMIRFMALMNFPRYIDAEARDFFYLTLRPILPGDPVSTAITPPEPGEGVWRTHDLPQHGWPYAVATTFLRPDPARTHARVGLIKLDGRRLRVGRPDDVAAKPVIEFGSPQLLGTSALWHSESGGFAIGADAPAGDAVRITAGYAPGTPGSQRALGAVGIDDSGMLLYARITAAPDPERDPELLLALLRRLGCESPLLLPRPLGASLGETEPEPAVAGAARPQGVVLVRVAGPGAERIFVDTPIVPPNRWAVLQRRPASEE